MKHPVACRDEFMYHEIDSCIHFIFHLAMMCIACFNSIIHIYMKGKPESDVFQNMEEWYRSDLNAWQTYTIRTTIIAVPLANYSIDSYLTITWRIMVWNTTITTTACTCARVTGTSTISGRSSVQGSNLSVRNGPPTARAGWNQPWMFWSKSVRLL